jgi:hypothetical protein
MAVEKSLGVRLVADERIQSRTGRKIAEHIFVVGEQLVGDAAGGDFALRVIDFLYVLFVNVAPPRLRVADEINLREFLQRLVKILDPEVVCVVLKMQQHRHAEFSRYLGHGPHKF